MPRKKRQLTPFGALVEPAGAYIVSVTYHRDNDFVTLDYELMKSMLDAFDRKGWKYKVERRDFHYVPGVKGHEEE